jgi:hypothetical protein
MMSVLMLYCTNILGHQKVFVKYRSLGGEDRFGLLYLPPMEASPHRDRR